MTLFFAIASFIFGTIIGSFLNVVIWRLPRNKSLGSLNGRSECPHCHHVLGAGELVPLLSFLSSRGKCRHCSQKISWRYPIIESITGVLFLAAFMVFHPSIGDTALMLLFIQSLIAIAFLIVIFVIDLEHFLILDKVIFPGLALFTLFNLALDLVGHTFAFDTSYLIAGLIGAVGASGVFFLIWFLSRGRWMGFGDVKLTLFLGMIFGYKVWLLILLAFWMGFVVAIILLISKRAHFQSKLPFGTFLSLAGVLMLFYGNTILNWYLRLIGFYTG